MPMWRCPHCGTPQPEAARCWVCHRSSTSCATCRHFRRSVAGDLGFCGLDRRRAPLHGDELRGCWDAGQRPEPIAPEPPVGRTAVRARRDFVPLDPSAGYEPETPAPPPFDALVTTQRPPDEGRWALFPEVEA